jgi:hypothetical protein
MHRKIVENNTTVVKPQIDASDGEMHYKNRFSHMCTNLNEYMQTAYKDSDFARTVFRPKSLGAFSKTNLGT